MLLGGGLLMRAHLSHSLPAGGAWPCARRSHAAVLLGDCLFVHGGLDGAGDHLSDLWQLDLHTWVWRQLSVGVPQQGSAAAPAARRAHCLAGLQGRYLLMQGGYRGSAKLLSDAWVFDTRAPGRGWLPVQVQGVRGTWCSVCVFVCLCVIPSGQMSAQHTTTPHNCCYNNQVCVPCDACLRRCRCPQRLHQNRLSWRARCTH
jgi:hypothetical protein